MNWLRTTLAAGSAALLLALAGGDAEAKTGDDSSFDSRAAIHATAKTGSDDLDAIVVAQNDARSEGSRDGATGGNGYPDEIKKLKAKIEGWDRTYSRFYTKDKLDNLKGVELEDAKATANTYKDRLYDAKTDLVSLYVRNDLYIEAVEIADKLTAFSLDNFGFQSDNYTNSRSRLIKIVDEMISNAPSKDAKMKAITAKYELITDHFVEFDANGKKKDSKILSMQGINLLADAVVQKQAVSLEGEEVLPSVAESYFNDSIDSFVELQKAVKAREASLKEGMPERGRAKRKWLKSHKPELDELARVSSNVDANVVDAVKSYVNTFVKQAQKNLAVYVSDKDKLATIGSVDFSIRRKSEAALDGLLSAISKVVKNPELSAVKTDGKFQDMVRDRLDDITNVYFDSYLAESFYKAADGGGFALVNVKSAVSNLDEGVRKALGLVDKIVGQQALAEFGVSKKMKTAYEFVWNANVAWTKVYLNKRLVDASSADAKDALSNDVVSYLAGSRAQGKAKGKTAAYRLLFFDKVAAEGSYPAPKGSPGWVIPLADKVVVNTATLSSEITQEMKNFYLATVTNIAQNPSRNLEANGLVREALSTLRQDPNVGSVTAYRSKLNAALFQ